MTIKQRRIEKGWSQIQLAEFAGISLRTIQRIEKGHTPTIDTIKSLASVFEVHYKELIGQDNTTELDESQLNGDELKELERVREIQRFLRDLACFLVLVPIIFILNMIESFNGEWCLWLLVGWGGYLAFESYSVFEMRDFFGKGWEKKALEKRLGRKID